MFRKYICHNKGSKPTASQVRCDTTSCYVDTRTFVQENGGMMEFIIFILPVLALIWLVVSIVKFCRTDKEKIEERKFLKKQIIISAAIIVAWIAIIVGFCFLIMYSIMVNGM